MSTAEHTAPGTEGDPADTVEDLFKRADAIEKDAQKAKIDLLYGSPPLVRNAANYLHNLWRIPAKASPNAAPSLQHETPATRGTASSREALMNEQAELLSHVANLLDRHITQATPDYPGVSPATISELQKRRDLDQLVEAEWWVEREMKDKSSNKDVADSLSSNIVRNQFLQAQLRDEIYLAHLAEALTQDGEIFERSEETVENSDGDFAAFRDACRLMVARHDTERRQRALTRRALAATRDGNDLASENLQYGAHSIGQTADTVGRMMRTLQESVVDDSVRDAIETLHKTGRPQPPLQSLHRAQSSLEALMASIEDSLALQS